MSLYAVYYVIFISSISLAASSALLFDAFFFVSLRHRRIDQHESKTLRMLSGISSMGSITAISMLICLMALRISYGMTPGEHILVGMAVLLAIAFSCSIILRNFHLPSLKRHQHEHHHLSESFAHHQDSLLSTSALSLITWIYLITIIAADSRGLIENDSLWCLLISYIVIAFIFSKVAVFTKKKIS